MFGRPQLTEDDVLACQDDDIIKNLGTIQHRFMRVKHLTHLPSYPRTFADSVEEPVLSEAGKKAALSHKAKYAGSSTV